MNKLKVLDLFSGIGGFSLGLERTGGFETVAFCEIEPFPIKVLNKHWPDVPVYNDVRTLDYDGTVDVITGGFPCQPFSLAGERKGKEDDRHLWPAMLKLIKKHRPTWVIGENVAGLITLGLDSVLADLESEGYRTRTFVIPAVSLNACHRRDRVWIVSHSDKNIREQRKAVALDNEAEQHNGKRVQPTSHTTSKRQQGQRELDKSVSTEATEFRKTDFTVNALGWPTKPAICRRDDGVPGIVDRNRLACLGNAVVPQIPEIIGDAILQSLDVPNDEVKK